VRVALCFPRFRYPCGDPPLGVAYLAAVLREEGVEVDILDSTFWSSPLDKYGRLFGSRRYDIVGISCMTSMVRDALEVAKAAKGANPRCLVVVGGPHPTVMPEHVLSSPFVDAVAIGEGERTIIELVRAGGDFTKVPGMAYKEGREVKFTPPRKPLDNLDEVPFPAWDLLPMSLYLKHWYQLDAVSFGLKGTNILGSRGCPFDCTYCQPTLRALFGHRLRKRSPESIVAELEELRRRYGIQGFMWLDDTFTIDRGWVRRVCNALIDADLGLVWGCNVRADFYDPDLLALMKRAGLRVVHIGIETASQRILDGVYRKGVTVEGAERLVRLAKRMGLKVRGYFMLGAPTETLREALSTVWLAVRLPLDDATFSITTPLPGTHLYRMTRHLIARPVEEFDYYREPVYHSSEVLHPLLLDLVKKWAYLQFYALSPRAFKTIRSFFDRDAFRKLRVKLKRF